MDTADVLYHGYEGSIVRERSGDDANTRAIPPPSSFTAINQQSSQTLTPPSSTPFPIQQNQSRRRAAGSGRRSHHPAVAQYLGLGSPHEPTHLEKYAPLPVVRESPPPKPVRKRRRLAACDYTLGDSRLNERGSDIPDQQGVSESFRVTRSKLKSAKPKFKAAASATPQLKSMAPSGPQTSITSGIPHTRDTDQVLEHVPRANPTAMTASQETMPASQAEALTLQHDDETYSDAENFDFDINEEELLMLTSEIDKQYSDSINNISSSAPQTNCESDHKRSIKGTVASNSQRSLTKFVSPITLTTRLLTATNDMGSAKVQNPIVRPPFPEPVRDRSPIIGLSSDTRLRTGFRIGEAINQSCHAAKSGYQIIIELYARVLASERTGSEQKFTFCDLFHAKPPYITGVYTAAIWKSVQLFEYDSRRLLQQGRMCRCIGTMKRDGKEWIMTVLNIWEATWEDIEWIEGIVGA